MGSVYIHAQLQTSMQVFDARMAFKCADTDAQCTDSIVLPLCRVDTTTLQYIGHFECFQLLLEACR